MTESFPVSSNTIRFTTLDLSLLFFFLKNFSSFSAGTSSWDSEFDKDEDREIKREKKDLQSTGDVLRSI